jgi:uncharacterized protein (DUF433 family)
VLETTVGLRHALASRHLYSDGAEVLFDFAERSGERGVADDLTVVRSGQRVFAPVVLDYLKRITYGADDWPEQIELPRFGQAVVVIDPARGFGRPLFAHGAARVEDVLDRWRAGEFFDALARDFGVPVAEIEDAARAAATRVAA